MAAPDNMQGQAVYNREEMLAAALGDVRRLFERAIVGGHIPADRAQEVSEQFAHLDTLAPATITKDDEVKLWKMYADLVRFASPATVSGLRTAAEIEEHQRKESSIFGRPKGPAIRRAITCAGMIMAVALVFVISLQIYSIFGTSILKEIELRSTAYEQAQREETQVRITNPNANEDEMPLREILSRKLTAEKRLTANMGMLDVWNGVWRTPFRSVAKFFSGSWNEEKDQAVRAVANVQYAQAVLQAISLYFLPLFYGLLGASVFVLRRIGSELEQSNFGNANPYRYRLRYALGAVLGATAGLIFDPTAIGTPESPVQVAAFAFIAGFSVEAVFSQLDSIVAGWRKRVGEKAPQAPT